MVNLKKSMEQNEKTVTWFQVNNIIPLIFSAVSITISFMSLSNKIDLANQKLATLVENQTVLISKYEGVQVRLGLCELNVNTLTANLNNHLKVK